MLGSLDRARSNSAPLLSVTGLLLAAACALSMRSRLRPCSGTMCMCSGTSQPHSRTGAGQPLALGLVGVRHQHGDRRHRRAARRSSASRCPGRRRALEDARRRSGVRRAAPRHVDRSFSGRTIAWQRVARLQVAALAQRHRRPAVEPHARRRCRWPPPTSPGIRFETPMKPATNWVRRALVDLLGRGDLLDDALVHHRDPVGHRQRLLLVVRHVEERDADLALDVA